MRIFIIILMVLITPPMVAPSSSPDWIEIDIEKPVEDEIVIVKDYYAFLNDIGHRESGNRYGVVNKYGYMGRFQFGKSTLRTLKIKVDKETFLSNPQLQDYAMHKLLCYNQNKLKYYIDNFEGQIVHGILVTESGILAAAHLGGAGSVKRWFKTGKVRKDGNGVKITSYMERFSGDNLGI